LLSTSITLVAEPEAFTKCLNEPCILRAHVALSDTFPQSDTEQDHFLACFFLSTLVIRPLDSFRLWVLFPGMH